MEKEYAEGVRLLKKPGSFPLFKPAQGKGKQTAEQIWLERKEKMMLLGMCSHASMKVLNAGINNATFPLGLYEKEGSVYDDVNRGRIPRQDEQGNPQNVRPHTLGIMRAYMPLPKDDTLFAPEPAEYARGADNSTFKNDKTPTGELVAHQMPDEIFATKVTPFVNSISGTMLIHLRMTAQLLREHKYTYEAQGKNATKTEEQLKNYFKSFVSYMIYMCGGHSIHEFLRVMQLPEVKEEFKDLPGFDSLNLETLFKAENDDAFERAVDKTVDYNTTILQRKELHEELIEPKLDRKLKEVEDELTISARSRLKSVNDRLGEKTSLDRENKAINKAYNQYVTPRNEETENEGEYNVRVREAEATLVEKFNIKKDGISDKKNRSMSIFHQIMSKMLECQDQLRQDLYNGRGTLAQRLDKAWGIYKDDKSTEEDKLIAQSFMIFALDVIDKDIFENLNQTLEKLMLERELHKGDNPDFIPGKSLVILSEQIKSDLKQTDKTGVTNVEAVNKLIQNKDILDVNLASKLKDQGQLKDKHGRVNGKKTVFFNPEERDMLRVIVRKGAFHSGRGKVFDTQESISHYKKGFAAFTLNVNGELSVFQHINHDKTGVAHSSINSGLPVLSAGEIEIKNGKLISITEHSGHYRPSLYSMYKTLVYFKNQGIDISDVKVYTFTPCKKIETHLKIDVSQSKEFGHFRVINAGELCNSFHAHLKSIVNLTKKDLEAYQTPSFMKFLYKIKDFIIGSTLTKDREEIAKKLSEGLVGLTKEINSANSLQSMKVVNKKIDKLIETAKNENVELNRKHYKDDSHGNFAQHINFFREKLGEMSGRVKAGLKAKENGLESSEEEILSCSDQLKGMGRK